MHHLLRRQLRRIGIPEDGAAPTAEQWSELLRRVDRTYSLAEQDRYTMERSLSVCSTEMQQLYDDLRASTESELATERDRLKRSLATLHAALEASLDAVLVVGPDRSVIAYNHGFVEVWGLPDAVLSEPSDEALIAHVLSQVADPAAFVARIDELYDRPDARSREEIRFVDGRIIDRFSAPVMSDGLAIGRVWFFRDVTARRRMEEAVQRLNHDLEQRVQERTSELEETNRQLLRQIGERNRAEQSLRQAEEKLRVAQKMEAVGRLAGGIAHDFNNMLAVIVACSALVRDALSPEHEAWDDVHEVERAAERASDLTKRLLALSRQQVLRPELTDLSRVVRSVEEMMARLIGTQIELAVRAPAGPCPVLIDRGQLEQALVNLVINARDAMPGDGRIEITVRGTTPEELSELPTGRSYFAVDVTDDGTGMDLDTQARIFEPFFTTKEPGKGTGLGLAMVYGVVQQSGGQIFVRSELGQGTRFTMFLPQSAMAPRARPTEAVEPSCARGTVMLVDDEPLVRVAGRRVLTRAGMHVIEAGGMQEALALYAQRSGEIDLLVTDVMMPRGSGLELVERLRALDPSLPVVFVSGHAPPDVLEAARSLGVFLQKPFTPGQLLAAVRSSQEARPRPRAVAAGGSLRQGSAPL